MMLLLGYMRSKGMLRPDGTGGGVVGYWSFSMMNVKVGVGDAEPLRMT